MFPVVVYEHRSRLEKSLQKERLEHKKAKDGEKSSMYTQSRLKEFVRIEEFVLK